MTKRNTSNDSNDSKSNLPSRNGVSDKDAVILTARVKDGGVGGETAFEELLVLYQPLIISIASSFAGSAASFGNVSCYNDICQELNMALYKAALTFDGKQSKVTFGKYAKVCLTNKAISVLRKLKSQSNKEKKIKRHIEEKLEHQSRENSSFSGLTDSEKSRFLSTVGGVLSSFEYKVLEKYLDGMSAREISAELSVDGSVKANCSEKSVNNAVYRAKAKIKKALGGSEENGRRKREVNKLQ